MWPSAALFLALIASGLGDDTSVGPMFIKEPPNRVDFSNTTGAVIECTARGNPTPEIIWVRSDGTVVGEVPGLRQVLTNGNLVFPPFRAEDYRRDANAQVYICSAKNTVGTIHTRDVNVRAEPPRWIIEPTDKAFAQSSDAKVECKADGFPRPTVAWKRATGDSPGDYKDLKPNNRDVKVEEGTLLIHNIQKTSEGYYLCEAVNGIGSGLSAVIKIRVHEVPEAPYGLKVLDKSDRTVQLSWIEPYDGNSPIKRYLVEYKISKGKWDNDIDRVMVPGHQTMESIPNLSAATTYHMRVVAENKVGTSEPSEPVMIITADGAPSGPPTNVKVEGIDEVTLKVTWNPPEKEHWNGEILGYYVGYKLSNSYKPYLFETIEFSKEEGKEHHLLINSLKTYTQYSVVVQAFNKFGAGPTTEEIKQYTAEGTPNEPPKDPTCTALTSQTIMISWDPLNLATANGVIRGYKVIYGPTDNWYDEKSKDSKITQASETIIHGLKKFTNYTMQVLAYTACCDGVRSDPIHCQTEQDVPDSPTAIKALAMSEDSILISWKPPSQPNGIISQYTVYIKEESKGKKLDDVRSQKIPPYQMTYEASGLNKDEKYEFSVTASTNIGEGRPSKPVVLTLNNKVPAKIASFDSKFTATYHEDVKLPCLTVGQPTPDITWKIKGVTFKTNDRMQQLPEGSLLIKSVTRTDAGEYSCHVQNFFGHDSVTHHLIILAPPHMPHVTLTSITTNSITLKIKPNPQDVEPVHGFTVKYKPEFGEWKTAQLPSTIHKYTLENLWCGSRYMISVTAYNSIGTGDDSDILNTRTKGSKPIIPDASRFIEASTNSITLHMSTWSDGGCPMLYFVVEHKKKISTQWNQVSNNVKPGGNFVVLDLDPATWYNLRVTAHNNAGFAVAEYEFATLTITGGEIF